MTQRTLVVGEIIVAKFIGEGFYEIVSFGETYVNVKCLKLFGKGWDCRGHITNCHNYPSPINMNHWMSYRRPIVSNLLMLILNNKRAKEVEDETRRALMNMNTTDFNTMRSMLSEIEMKIMQVDPMRQRLFYKFIQNAIFEAWQDACNPEDQFLYTFNECICECGYAFTESGKCTSCDNVKMSK